jgi:hypothetical protein
MHSKADIALQISWSQSVEVLEKKCPFEGGPLCALDKIFKAHSKTDQLVVTDMGDPADSDLQADRYERRLFTGKA